MGNVVKLYSQHDPEYGGMKLGTTNVYEDGCVVSSLSTLFQVEPNWIISLKGVINSRGECDISRFMEYLGGKIPYRGKIAPNGWCLAKTNYYKKFHYFCYNRDTGECIDPLLNPTARQPNRYPIIEYIWLTNIKLDFTAQDLEKRVTVAENALKSGRLSGLRSNFVVRFIKRAKDILSSFLS
tara:strand:+ start:625 stop:1170 length:546 start_codon:yes stop_codon:yes gene_type:complete